MNSVKSVNYANIEGRVTFVTSIEDAEEIVMAFEEHTTSKFVTSKQKKTFGKSTEPKDLKARILWEDIANQKASGHRLKFDGCPFMVVGDKILDCHHGVDRHVSAKAKYKARRESEERLVYKRRRFLTQDTKKVGCPAKIKMRELLKFPYYKICVDTKPNRLREAKRLKEDLVDRDVRYERRIYIELPDESDHSNHLTGEKSGRFQSLDKSIVRFIHGQVTAGVGTVADMKLRVTKFINDCLFNGRDLPHPTNRRYNPTDQDIRNHMYLGRLKTRALLNPDQLKDQRQLRDHQDITQNFISVPTSLPQKVILLHQLPSYDDMMSAQRFQVEMIPSDSFRSVPTDGSSVAGSQNDCSEDTGYVEEVDDCPEEETEETSSSLTIHLQVEPEQTEAMATDCRRLLRTIHKQTYELRDPNVLHQLSTTLREVVAILSEETSQTLAKANSLYDVPAAQTEFINDSDMKDTKSLPPLISITWFLITQKFISVPTSLPQKVILLHQLPSYDDMMSTQRFQVEMIPSDSFRSVPTDGSCVAGSQNDCSEDTGYVEEVDDCPEEETKETSLPLTIHLQVSYLRGPNRHYRHSLGGVASPQSSPSAGNKTTISSKSAGVVVSWQRYST